MADIVSAATRSRMMSGIRSVNTKPELQIRKALHREGFRYRIHVKGLPGNPDIVLPSWRAVIFVHGCFWHRHECGIFRWPSARQEFWKAKLDRNFDNDESSINKLRADGWRVAVVWECSLRGKNRIAKEKIVSSLKKWICSKRRYLEIKGRA